MGESLLCADEGPEVLVGAGDLEEHESDHEVRVSRPSADSEAGLEGEVCNPVDDAIWIEKLVFVSPDSGDVGDDDSGRHGAHGDDIRKCGAETTLLGYPHVDGPFGGLSRVRT